MTELSIEENLSIIESRLARVRRKLAEGNRAEALEEVTAASINLTAIEDELVE
jgi:hypothetical protein